jgi:hypothetical protein
MKSLARKISDVKQNTDVNEAGHGKHTQDESISMSTSFKKVLQELVKGRRGGVPQHGDGQSCFLRISLDTGLSGQVTALKSGRRHPQKWTLMDPAKY